MTEVSHKMTMPGYGVFLPNMYCEEPMQIVDQKLAATLRYLRMRGGDRCRLRKQGLDKNEGNKQYPRENQQCDVAPIAPLETVNTPKSRNDSVGDPRHPSGHPTEVPI